MLYDFNLLRKLTERSFKNCLVRPFAYMYFAQAYAVIKRAVAYFFDSSRKRYFNSAQSINAATSITGHSPSIEIFSTPFNPYNAYGNISPPVI